MLNRPISRAERIEWDRATALQETDVVATKSDTAPGGFDAMVDTTGADIAETTPQYGGQMTWTDTPEFDEDEVGYPLLRLGQGLTGEVAEGTAKMGDWILSGYTPLQEVTLIPMFFARTRKLTERDRGEVTTLCSSSDGRIGIGVPGGECKACPKAQWSTDPRTGRRSPPACDLIFNYGCYSVEHTQVVQLSLKGTSTISAQTINNLVQANGGRLGTFAIKVTSRLDRSGQNVYAVPIVQFTLMTEEWRALVASLAQFTPMAKGLPVPQA